MPAYSNTQLTFLLLIENSFV